MNEKRMEKLLGRVREAQRGVLDAAAIIREAPPASTFDAARMHLACATGELSGAVNILHEEIAKAEGVWCDGCGDGAPGKMEHLTRGTIPCTVCHVEDRAACAQDEGFA